MSHQPWPPLAPTLILPLLACSQGATSEGPRDVDAAPCESSEADHSAAADIPTIPTLDPACPGTDEIFDGIDNDCDGCIDDVDAWLVEVNGPLGSPAAVTLVLGDDWEGSVLVGFLEGYRGEPTWTGESCGMLDQCHTMTPGETQLAYVDTTSEVVIGETTHIDAAKGWYGAMVVRYGDQCVVAGPIADRYRDLHCCRTSTAELFRE